MPVLLTPSHRPVTTRPPVPPDDITRRDLLKGVGALGAGWVLAGCGVRDGGSSAGGDTRTFVDSAGREVEVPATAQRIVATHDTPGAQLLSLGAPVVGLATRSGGFSDGVTRFFEVDDLAPAGEYFEPDLEAIVALDPAAARLIEAALARALTGRTLVVIAHRPATALACDLVAVIRDGRLASTGAPAEVMERDEWLASFAAAVVAR